MRDHPLLGPAEVPTSVPVPGQTNSTTDSNLPFLKSYPIRSHGELPTIQQGDLVVSW